jgi:hypothetical protein
MAHMQISTETSIWLLQAKEFLDEARRLRPGPARNELRQVAKVLRELAKLEAHLAVLFRDAANLNLQLCELKRLRDRVRQAQRPARKSQRTNLTGTREEWLAARRHAKNPGEGDPPQARSGGVPLTRSLRGVYHRAALSRRPVGSGRSRGIASAFFFKNGRQERLMLSPQAGRGESESA